MIILFLLSLKLSQQQSIPSISIIPDNTNPPWKTSFSLTCSADSWSANTIFFWRRDGSTFYPSSSSDISFSENKQIIYFNSMVARDSGSFSCAALDTEHYFYEVSPQLQINVREPPEVPKELAVNGATHDSLSVRWNHIGTVLPSYYILSTNDGLEVRAESNTAVLQGLLPYTQYTLSVSSYNDIGTKGPGTPLLTRTETAPPSGTLEFIIGLRTSDSLQVVWSVPHISIVNDELTGYIIQISNTLDSEVYKYSTNVTEALIEALETKTQYTVTMHFTTACCTSQPSVKVVSTTTEGVTYEPTVHPATGGAVKLKSSDIVGIVVGSITFVVLLTLLLLGALYWRRRRTGDSKSPGHGWRDDNVPVSPPPMYSSPAAPLSFNYAPAHDVVNRSIVLNHSNSEDYNSTGGQVTPPPAYQSRNSLPRSPSRSPSDNNSSLGRGTPRPLDSIRPDVRERDGSIKIVNRTPRPSSSIASTSPSSVSYIRQERALTPPLDNSRGDWI